MAGSELAPQVAIVVSVLAVGFLTLVWPQLRRESAHNQFMASLMIGDQVVTSGGLVGRIVSIDDERIVQLAITESSIVRVMRNRIEERLP